MSFFDTLKKDVGGAEKAVGGFLGNITNNPVGKIVNNIVNPTAPVPTALRNEAINIGHSIAKIPETTIRSIAQPAADAANSIVGNPSAPTSSGAVTDPIRSFLYGSHDPVQTYQQRGVGASAHLPDNLKGPGAIVLPALLGGLDLSNLLGGGEGEKLAQNLAKETSVQGVKDLLGSAGATIGQDVISKIAKSTKPGEIKSLLKSATSAKDEAVKALGTQAPGAEESFYKVTGATADQAKTLAQQSKDALAGNLARTGQTTVAPIAGNIHPSVSTAANDLAKFYNTVPDLGNTAHDLIRTTNGYIEAGGRVAKGLEKAITKALPEASDRQALRDLAEGAVKPEDVSPAVRDLHEALKPLTQAGFDVRQAVDGTFKATQNYATRIPVSKLKGEPSQTGRIGLLGKVKDVNQLFDNTSKFSQGRQVGKFVGEDGKAVFGSPQSLGFKTVAEKANTFAKDGQEFTKVPTTAKEIEKSGVIAYEKDAAKIQGTYHQDTTALKARNEALHALQTDPKYGLSADPVIPKGNIEITKIPELTGWHGPRKTVNELEKNFQTYDKGGLLQRAWTGITRPVVQAIVLNPLFHGTNQLAQSFIAAGKIPIADGTKVSAGPIGGLKQLGNVFKILADPAARETAARGYLEAGGHIPKYGSDVKGSLYNALEHVHLGGVTKLNSRTMSLIEETLRSSTWQASVNAGMDAKDAAANIDHYMGDKAAMSKVAQNFGLFLHYLKTTTGALYGAARHPIQEAGATTNALTVLAATLAVQQGWREFSGNPNATVRFPGELGTAKSIIDAPGQLAAGKTPSVVTNHINPVLLGLAEQVFNKDIHTGADLVAKGADVGTGVQARLANALGIVAPINQAQQVASGYKTPTQIAQSQLGLYTPGTPKAKSSGRGRGRPRGSSKGSRTVKGRIGGVGKISKASRGTRARKGTGRIKSVRVSTKSRAIKALKV